MIAESARQNLVAASTIPDFERRHLADSLQLLPHLRPGVLLDIGSGAGFPGMVLACCRVEPTHLIEPRAKRAAFLEETARALDLGTRVTIHAARVQRVQLPPVATITARAVASLDVLFAMAEHLSDPETRWVLPKGRSAAQELEAARATWQGEFRLTTDPEASIVLAEGIRRRRHR